MSYEKFYPGGWQSGETGGTPITPEALNHIENGIKQTYSDFAPAGHVTNKSNPHGVTAAQIGAIPLTGSQNITGVLMQRVDGNPYYGLYDGAAVWYLQASKYEGKVGLGTSWENATKCDASGNMEVKGTIKEGDKVLSDKYAPEGYGLGKQVPPVMADANAITPAQFFRVTTNTANLNNTSHWSGIVMPYTADEIVQFIVQTTRGTARLRRTEDGGATWTDLYMNPRLVSGKEYATTETNDDDIVYVKKIRHTTTTDFGVTNGASELSIAHDITNLDRLVRITGVLGKVYPLPFISDTGATISIKSVTSTNIVLRAVNGVWRAGLMEFDLYYTKTE